MQRLLPRASVLSVCLLLFCSLTALAGAKHKLIPRNLNVDPQAEAVDLFDGIDKGLLDARLIPKNADGGNIIVENKSDRPLTVKVPPAFAAVQVLKQAGRNGRGGGGGNSQGGGGGGAAQPMGGGMGMMGGGGMGMMGGGMMGGRGMGMFSVAPEEMVQVPMKSVCLEHGKPDPRPSMTYKLIPLKQQNSDPVLGAMLEQFVAGNVDQKAAQAAAWHLANHMSWQELAAKKIRHVGGVPPEPYFRPQQLAKAQELVTIAQGVARQQETEKPTLRKHSQDTPDFNPAGVGRGSPARAR